MSSRRYIVSSNWLDRNYQTVTALHFLHSNDFEYVSFYRFTCVPEMLENCLYDLSQLTKNWHDEYSGDFVSSQISLDMILKRAFIGYSLETNFRRIECTYKNVTTKKREMLTTITVA